MKVFLLIKLVVLSVVQYGKCVIPKRSLYIHARVRRDKSFSTNDLVPAARSVSVCQVRELGGKLVAAIPGHTFAYLEPATGGGNVYTELHTQLRILKLLY
ncbi:hypothetical protein BaRGS_00008332 [Batillaria attramentaria]|uniref:Secreted protein n=1 Tax=Batillaria attramentaria TaxID=370345 RepID=A0ABD0LLU5_9CAEN